MKKSTIKLLIVVLAMLLCMTACKSEEINRIETKDKNESQQEQIEEIKETEADKENEFDLVLREIEGYIEKAEYETALDIITTAIEEYPSEQERLLQKQDICRKGIVLDIVARADAYMEVYDKINAYTLLEEIKTDYSDYIDIYNERLSHYIAYTMPKEKYLLEEQPFAYDGAYGGNASVTTKKEYESKMGLHKVFTQFVVSQGNNEGKKPYIEYQLGGGYQHLRGTIVCSIEMEDNKLFHMEIYGDDKLLYTTETITSESDMVSFTIDIPDVDLLKLVCIREDHNLPLCEEQPNMAIVELVAYNDEIEFEYYADIYEEELNKGTVED